MYFFHTDRGFDIANHFVEWTMDYTVSEPPYFYLRPQDFPTREQQLHFIRAYLRKFSAESGDSSNVVCSAKEEEEILKEVLR